MCGRGIGHGGELGAGQVVAVHGEESRDARAGRQAWVFCVVELIDSLGDFGGEGCFAWEVLMSMCCEFGGSLLSLGLYLPEPGMPLTAISRR